MRACLEVIEVIGGVRFATMGLIYLFQNEQINTLYHLHHPHKHEIAYFLINQIQLILI